MRTQDIKMNDILNSRGSKLIIGDNQRYYKWLRKECKQLLNDILKYAKYKPYWIGFIMTKVTTYNDMNISDGQQRITTFSLIYNAIKNVILSTRKFKNNDDLTNFAQQINETFIIDKFSNHPIYRTKNRLILRKGDNDSYEDIINNQIKIDNNDNITKNYYFFYNFFKKKTKEELYEIINILENVFVTHVFVEVPDNEYLIFKSLNSTGRELTPGEVIKNSIFNVIQENGCKHDLIEKVNKIEINSLRNIDNCLRYWYYVTAKKWLSSKNRDVFISEITRYIENNNITSVVNSLYNFSELYNQILTLTYENDKINSFLKRSIRDNNNYNILIFDVLSNNVLTVEQKLRILEIGENIFFRKWICGHGFLQYTFINVLKKTLEQEGDIFENFIKVIKEIPGTTWGPNVYNSIPTDKEFIDSFKERDLYAHAITSSWKKYIFNALENSINGFKTKEYIDIYEMMSNGKISIEHIIPQTPTKEWENILKDDTDEVYKKYIHTIGNLTITGYNSEYSNKSFTVKKEMVGGFKDSSFKLNILLSEYENFTKKELLERQNFLSHVAIQRWSLNL